MNDNKTLKEGEFEVLVRDRIKNFWGYGNIKGKTWFIGMEEGTNQDIENLVARFRETADREVFDLVEDFKSDPRHVNWFKDKAPTQATYRKLIYLLLYTKNKTKPTLDEIRDYQIHNFGRKTSDHAILELMPLPVKSLSKKDWIYSDTNIAGLENRKSYLDLYKPERVKRLHQLISIHKPKVVIFYSLTYLPDWQSIIPKPLNEVISRKLYTAKDDVTLYAVIPHSTARKVSSDDWEKIAENLIHLI